jgi:16S rRNA (uracil1498-N3)-methyltransferase
MQIFYTTDTDHTYLTLHDDEARHCSQVLRKKVGDSIDVFDGQGHHYTAILEDIKKTTCVLKIVETVLHKNTKSLLHIACCPTKNIERFEWFLEKATEIGIDSVTPLLTQNSERRQIRNDRLDKILLSAMKQSLHYHLPKLYELTTFEAFVLENKTFSGKKLIAHCHDDIPKISLLSVAQSPENTLILIGPEGDFTKKEVEFALKHGFLCVSLGTARLRTETAAIVACTTLNLFLC